MVAAKVFNDEITAAGFKVEKRKPHIGGATGTAVHAAIAAMLTVKRDTLQVVTDIDKVLVKPLEEFSEAMKEGAEFDATTKTIDQAMLHIKQQTRVFAAKVLPRIHPKLIEYKVSAPITAGYELVGTLDSFDNANFVHDAKTGTRDKNHIYQIGGYILGLENEGERVQGAQVDWLKRTNKPADPVHETYPVRGAKEAAFAMSHRIVQDHKLFMETGNEWAFTANPNTVLCSKKYCPAHGTNFCALGRDKSEEE
jgi:hypothetical protein